jgi:hypothetical protein
MHENIDNFNKWIREEWSKAGEPWAMGLGVGGEFYMRLWSDHRGRYIIAEEEDNERRIQTMARGVNI